VSAKPRHWFEEHTGEVQLHLAAPTLAQLFVEAGLALAELIAEERTSASEERTEEVSVQAPDLEALLVEWLNELIFRGETQHKVYHELRVTSVSDRQLRAEIRGTVPDHLRTAVKAATFHSLHILSQPDGYSATVVLDV
jgi:SHS2 domain-containing protein